MKEKKLAIATELLVALLKSVTPMESPIEEYADIAWRGAEHLVKKNSALNKFENLIKEAVDKMPNHVLERIWNEHAPSNLGRVKIAQGSKRFKSATARWKEHPHEEFWMDALRRLSKSSFLTGKNDRNWKANFEFFMRPDKAQEILEGKYDDVKPSANLDTDKLTEVWDDA